MIHLHFIYVDFFIAHTTATSKHTLAVLWQQSHRSCVSWTAKIVKTIIVPVSRRSLVGRLHGMRWKFNTRNTHAMNKTITSQDANAVEAENISSDLYSRWPEQ